VTKTDTFLLPTSLEIPKQKSWKTLTFLQGKSKVNPKLLDANSDWVGDTRAWM
jgi:hypothetical protein